MELGRRRVTQREHTHHSKNFSDNTAKFKTSVTITKGVLSFFKT